MAMAAQSAMVRSESRRRLPDPPSGVEPVTVQSQFCQNESIQLEQRMQGMFLRHNSTVALLPRCYYTFGNFGEKKMLL